MKMSLVASRHRTLIALVVVLVIVAGVVSVAMAQPGPQQGEDGARRGGDMRAMMMRMAPPIMEVSGNAVFLFRGNTLYKFDADTLELLAQTELPMPQPPAPQ